MAKASQAGRNLQIKTPLGADALLLRSFSGTDALSELFCYDLDLLSDQTSPVDFSKILGQSVTVVVNRDGAPVYYNGIVSRFAQLNDVAGNQTNFHRYQAQVVPKLWLLMQQSNTRIFSQKAVPDIVKAVLQGVKTDWKLTGAYPTREYCVQYQETDFAFASRLLEEEGIYYFFTHKDGDHTMVLTNNADTHTPLKAPLVFRSAQASQDFADAASTWDKTQEIRPGKWSLRDHQMETPDLTFEAGQPVQATVSVGTVSHKLSVAANAGLEVYEYPGRFAHHYDNVAPGGGAQAMPGDLNQDPARIARLRMEQDTVPTVVIRAEVTLPGLYAGRSVDLSAHPHANGSYVVTRVKHAASLGDAYTTGASAAGENYHAAIECVPKALPFRPLRVTPRPIIHGTQTAVVVGGSNQNIFTDKYGRVKVVFPWDRLAAQSCWVRVATLWSDKTWGSQFIPRGGQEVVVAFEEGDPDKPMIVGCVYNNTNMPPFTLPDNATQSGIKTYCDGAGKFNLIRFEDKKDSEEIWVRAEKDYKREVQNNETTIVGVDGKAKDGSQSITILKDRKVEVTKGDETFTIKAGSRTHTVHKDESVTIETGNRTVKISQGNDSLTLDQGNRTTKLSAGSDSLEAAKSIKLKVGACSIEITTSGITIKAPQVSIQADSTAEVKGATTTVEGSGMLALKGGAIQLS